jgi:hypothetical protein
MEHMLPLAGFKMRERMTCDEFNDFCASLPAATYVVGRFAC